MLETCAAIQPLIQVYDVICEHTSSSLSRRVNEKLAKGWRLHGNMVISTNGMYTQPVVNWVQVSETAKVDETVPRA